MKMLEKSLSEMSPADLREFANSMGTELTTPTVPLILMAIQTAVRSSGFAAYRLSVVMLSTLAKVVLGRTLPIVTYLTLTRSISVLAGPVGIALSTGWLIADMAGPARRVTVPACLLVACLRQQYLYKSMLSTEILQYVCGRKTARSHGITAGDHHQSPADGGTVVS
ncbi:hypothetical protein [Enterobacter vonholyi]|uniref:hypothetical protein n=1 Tax=Enterobacter vonholyi TaxID=2797505 RepID=UPI002DB91A07|nr:hypothetical protein [Enterobacter vonholyi]MEB5980766.1 hypothetical protein [Enterobacter vonholyi]